MTVVADGVKNIGVEQIVKLVLTVMRLYLGAWMIINGLNHWLPIFPQPLGSFPQSNALLVVLIESGLFSLVKAIEVVGGVFLVLGWFVPLALVMLLPVSIVVFYNDAILKQRWNRIFYMGTGCMYSNLILMAWYVRYYLPMMTFKTELGSLQDLKKLPSIFSSKDVG
ncbi:MAG: DoxX family protein [Steroidobacteraceae bacterium]